MLMHFSVLMFFDWRVSLQPTIFPHSLPPSHTQQASSHLTKQPASRRKSLISHHHHVFWTSFFSQLRGHIESVHSKKKSTCPHCKVVVKVRCLNKKSNCVILKRLYLSVVRLLQFLYDMYGKNLSCSSFQTPYLQTHIKKVHESDPKPRVFCTEEGCGKSYNSKVKGNKWLGKI